MAILRTREIKNLNSGEIRAKIKDLQLELVRQKSQKPGQSNVKIKMREVRRTIARLNTKLNLLEKKKEEKPEKTRLKQ